MCKSVLTFLLALNCTVGVMAQEKNKSIASIRSIYHEWELSVGLGVASPQGSDIDGAMRFNTTLSVDYFFQENLSLGAQVESFKFRSDFDFNDYIGNLIARNIGTASGSRSEFSCVSAVLVPGYLVNLSKSPTVKGTTLKFGLGLGAMFISYPDRSVFQTVSGDNSSIIFNSYPEGTEVTRFLLKPEVKLNFFTQSRFGFSLQSSYAASLGDRKAYTFSYKDLSGVNFNASAQSVQDQIFKAPIRSGFVGDIKGKFSFGGGFILRFSPRTVKGSNWDREKLTKV